MTDLLKELCLLDGTSGREDDVRNFIISKIEGMCDCRVDPMGNIIAFKRNKFRTFRFLFINKFLWNVLWLLKFREIGCF